MRLVSAEIGCIGKLIVKQYLETEISPTASESDGLRTLKLSPKDYKTLLVTSPSVVVQNKFEFGHLKLL